MPLMLRYAVSAGEHSVSSEDAGLVLSRACSVVMILAYAAYLYFQLKTHRQLFEPQEVCNVCYSADQELKRANNVYIINWLITIVASNKSIRLKLMVKIWSLKMRRC
jgi:Ca2+/H+ antiporter